MCLKDRFSVATIDKLCSRFEVPSKGLGTFAVLAIVESLPDPTDAGILLLLLLVFGKFKWSVTLYIRMF